MFWSWFPFAVIWGGAIAIIFFLIKERRLKDKMGSMDRIKKIIVKQLGIDESKITENSSFLNDLGADSLDTIDLIMEFEEEFNIEIPDEDAEKIKTVGDVIKYLDK